MIRVSLEPARIRGLIDKFVLERQKTQEQQADSDGRQYAYHASGGAFIALFETLAELFSSVDAEDHTAAVELQSLMQLALEQYQQTVTLQNMESRICAPYSVDLFDLLYAPGRRP
jgi:hypothetical protein